MDLPRHDDTAARPAGAEPASAGLAGPELAPSDMAAVEATAVEATAAEAGAYVTDAGPVSARPHARRLRRPVEWNRLGRELAAGVRTILSAAVYATFIVTFVFQVARVDGLSMSPTLEDHDRLIVNKLAYEMGEPEPGDIVMLHYPLDPDKMFVKRVIAGEGDAVEIVDGLVAVNGTPLPDEYVPDAFRGHDNWGPTIVQPGHCFVLGDHRNNSSDSRHWGQVPRKYIVGKVTLRWWPLLDARIF
jgi:signal peptidase I